MLSERFWVLTVVLTLSVLQQEIQGQLANRDPRLTIVNVYSGLEAVDGTGKSSWSGSDQYSSSSSSSSDMDSDGDSSEDDDEEDDDYSSEDSEDMSSDPDDDPEDEGQEDDEEEEDDECCKMTYSNPKFAGKQHLQNSRKHADKKKKKHKQKMFYGKAPTAVAPAADTRAVPFSSASKDMNWNNFKKIIGHLKMKH